MSLEPPLAAIDAVVAAALDEDRAREDVTTLAVVRPNLRGRARLVAREAGTVCGLAAAERVFAALDPAIDIQRRIDDGGTVAAGTELAVVAGSVAPILQGERVALNLLQRLSGIATLTRRFVDAVAGTNATILDTRKTTPGLRDLEKWAVRCGGGTNHRRDLAAMAMIKDNHREALALQERSLADGVAAIRTRAPGVPVEVEIDSLDELDAALAAAPEWILLDNMPPLTMREAVERVAGRAKLEASGGITLEAVAAIAATGVDAISVGALTHSAPALDIALDLAIDA